MFDSLSERLERSFKILKGEGKISEINIAETMKDVRRALVEADVNYKTAKTFADSVKKKALGRNVLTSLKPREQMVGIVHEELVELMGGKAEPINLEGKPAVILMSGLQGSGKTTFSSKLARRLKSEGKSVLLVAADTHRPAAADQLAKLGEGIGVEVYQQPGETDAVKVAREGVEYGRQNHNNVVIVDTAGRLAVDDALMQEIEDIKNAVKPSEILFVVDAMTGQDAVNTAKAFDETLDFNGVVLTKLDGDTRGGAALSIRSVVDKPIKFVGTGERPEDIQVFNPEGMASRILGMGDIVELAQRAQEVFDEKEAKELEKKLLGNKFDFNDFRSQISKIKKMGNIKDLASMIPGVGKAIKDVDIDNDAFKSIEAIIDSMTPFEREHPNIIKGSRRQRIAAGSGVSIQEVNRVLKQFDEISKMMSMASNMKRNPKQMMQMAKQARAMQGMGRRR